MPFRLIALLILWGLNVAPAFATERVLTLSFDGDQRRLSASELLARPDAMDLTVSDDVSYKRAMTYRAVPLLGVLGNDLSADVDTIEARASDGFVSQIPAHLVKKGASAGAVAWLAIEDPNAPWPNLPGRDMSAGPFYLVWENPKRSDIGSEQWPYALVGLTGVQDPVQRWPQLRVDPKLPNDAEERRGQASFIKNCMPCHRINGAGESDIGPDLGRPMNVTEYMTLAGLRALIRDPKSVRTWPEQQMVGFDASALPDSELDALIAFLAHMAKR